MSDEKRPAPPDELWGLWQGPEWNGDAFDDGCLAVHPRRRDAERACRNSAWQPALIGVSPARLAEAEARAEKAGRERDRAYRELAMYKRANAKVREAAAGLLDEIEALWREDMAARRETEGGAT